jgi:hypothetical protein
MVTASGGRELSGIPFTRRRLSDCRDDSQLSNPRQESAAPVDRRRTSGTAPAYQNGGIHPLPRKLRIIAAVQSGCAAVSRVYPHVWGGGSAALTPAARAGGGR